MFPSSCLDGASHGWVPVNTHCTPVHTPVEKVWVAQTTRAQHYSHGSGAMSKGHDSRTQPSSRSCYATTQRCGQLIRRVATEELAKTEEPVTTEAVRAREPAAEPPVETTEAEIAREAEEPITKEIIRGGANSARPDERKLWNQPTSRKSMIKVLPNRVCSLAAERTDHRVQAQTTENLGDESLYFNSLSVERPYQGFPGHDSGGHGSRGRNTPSTWTFRTRTSWCRLRKRLWRCSRCRSLSMWWRFFRSSVKKLSGT